VIKRPTPEAKGRNVGNIKKELEERSFDFDLVEV
jgi:hypothetical protein